MMPRTLFAACFILPMVRSIMPLLNFVLNGFVLYKLSALLLNNYFLFEYVVLCLFFLFFCMTGIHGLFHSIFSFLDNKSTFNLLFIVQFLTAILIMQPLGFLFTVYLSFVMMLVYLIITKQPVIHYYFLHLCGITMGTLFLVVLS